MTVPPTDHRPGTDDDGATSASQGAGAPAEIIRSEERLRVRTDLHPTRRVRLRKRVVTEEVTHTVTVRREELVVEEEDLRGGAAPQQGGRHDFGDRDVEIVLHEERIVTSTRVVPVERVRVRIATVTDQVAVEEVLRRERVDVETVPQTELDAGAPGPQT